MCPTVQINCADQLCRSTVIDCWVIRPQSSSSADSTAVPVCTAEAEHRSLLFVVNLLNSAVNTCNAWTSACTLMCPQYGYFLSVYSNVQCTGVSPSTCTG
eukprot:scpid103118/ scgid14945/ 